MECLYDSLMKERKKERGERRLERQGGMGKDGKWERKKENGRRLKEKPSHLHFAEIMGSLHTLGVTWFSQAGHCYLHFCDSEVLNNLLKGL